MYIETYEESYLPLASFLSRIEVYCPSCRKRGSVHTDLPPISGQVKRINLFVDGCGKPSCEGPYSWTNARFACSACPRVIEFEHENPCKTWYGMIKGTAKAICYSCLQVGYKVSLRQEFHIKKCDLHHQNMQKMELSCPKCHSSTAANIGFNSLFDAGMLIDPIFGLPLFLTKTIGGKTIWAYNKEHLDHIKYFIQASQRKIIYEVDTAGRSDDVSEVQSFSQTLPAWIKKKNNRDNILKAISQMTKTF